MSPSDFNREKVLQASQALAPHIHRTPILTSSRLDKLAKANLFFKCENFQKTGSFKIRGATYAARALSAERQAKGLVTHSSGNHGQAVAYVAQNLGVKSYIIMAKTASKVKIEAVRSYNGEVIFCEPSAKSRAETCQMKQEETQASFIHPYNNPNIILGQSSVGKELFEDLADLDCVVCPVGGGGLVSGLALSGHFLASDVEVYGVEPSQANDAFLSFRTGQIVPFKTPPQSIADGLLAPVGELPFTIIKRLVKDIFVVSEKELIAAMFLIWQTLKIIVEPSCATVLAAVQSNRSIFEGKRVGLILTGGNVDFGRVDGYQRILTDNNF